VHSEPRANVDLLPAAAHFPPRGGVADAIGPSGPSTFPQGIPPAADATQQVFSSRNCGGARCAHAKQHPTHTYVCAHTAPVVPCPCLIWPRSAIVCVYLLCVVCSCVCVCVCVGGCMCVRAPALRGRVERVTLRKNYLTEAESYSHLTEWFVCAARAHGEQERLGSKAAERYVPLAALERGL